MKFGARFRFFDNATYDSAKETSGYPDAGCGDYARVIGSRQQRPCAIRPMKKPTIMDQMR
jgi:hypothetical protein